MLESAVPSMTARRVAAYRLAFERLTPPTEAGDPGADERLATDVAAGITVDLSSPMGRYLLARTAFFDRMTVNALGRQVTQIIAIGPGHDARALRYRTPGVQWWEVDRPATQTDKQARLSRLGIAADTVAYVALDLADGDLATALTASGFEPDAPALYLAEGVIPYIDDATLRSVLDDLRSLATPGTRLALSLRRSGVDPVERTRFEADVAALGEPAVGSASTEDAEERLAKCRWRPVEVSERSRAAGFVVAAPIFAPPGVGAPPTVGRIGTFVEQMLYRSGGKRLGAHIEAVYGIPVTGTREIDLGVHRVEPADGTTWMARVSPAARSLDAARGDAALLDWLVQAGIPAERTAAPEPVSMHEGQASSSPTSPRAVSRRPAPSCSSSLALSSPRSTDCPVTDRQPTELVALGTTSSWTPPRPMSWWRRGSCCTTLATASDAATSPPTSGCARRSMT
jgi:methyltransferase (TIGR00027 family)